VIARDFAPIAESLAAGLVAFERAGGGRAEGAAWRSTLDTNSVLVERRGQPLLEILRECAGIEALEGLDLVDLGCGFGALSLFFAVYGATVTGIDPHEPRLAVGRAVAERHGLHVRFRAGRMEKLDLGDASFDVAVQNNSLCYIVPRDERAAALQATLRVLRPGGWLVSRNPNRWNPIDQFTRLPLVHLLPPRQADATVRALGRRRSRVRLLSPPATRRELTRAGFERVAHVGVPGERRPAALRLFARYQHFAAQRSARTGFRPKSHPPA
jgi:SAM-dependent methyltransferase